MFRPFGAWFHQWFASGLSDATVVVVVLLYLNDEKLWSVFTYVVVGGLVDAWRNDAIHRYYTRKGW